MPDTSKPQADPQGRLETVREYFIRGDAGRPDLADLFTEDVQIYFPKFGIARGKAALTELGEGLRTAISALAHDMSDFRYVVASDAVVVEGTTQGADHDGVRWRGGETPGGRFCSVFEFRGALISRMHIYLDPDYASRDEARFVWGRERSW